MNLTTKQFAEVLKELNTSQAQREKENRRAQRVLHRCRVPVWLGKDLNVGLPTIVTVRDISSRGICLLHSRGLEVKSNFIIELAGETGPSSHILCTVARCRSESKTLYTIGAEFTSVLKQPAPPKAPPPPAPVKAKPITAAPVLASQSADVERIRRSMLD